GCARSSAARVMRGGVALRTNSDTFISSEATRTVVDSGHRNRQTSSLASGCAGGGNNPPTLKPGAPPFTPPRWGGLSRRIHRGAERPDAYHVADAREHGIRRIRQVQLERACLAYAFQLGCDAIGAAEVVHHARRESFDARACQFQVVRPGHE